MEDTPAKFKSFVAPLQQVRAGGRERVLWGGPGAAARCCLKRRNRGDAVMALPVDPSDPPCRRPLPPKVLVGLASASANATNAAALRAGVPKETVIGLFRDLRGVATATNSRHTYGARGRAGAAFGCLAAASVIPGCLGRWAWCMHAQLPCRCPASTHSITGMLFDWLYPAHFPTIVCCLEAWAGALGAAGGRRVLLCLAACRVNNKQAVHRAARRPAAL